MQVSKETPEYSVQPPYLLFLGDVTDIADSKTAAGIKQWRGELCGGQLRLPGCTVDLGLPDLTAAQAAERDVERVLSLTEQVLGQRDGYALILLQAELDDDSDI